MTNSLVLALDIGTSSVRAILFDDRGRERCAAGDQSARIEAQIKYQQYTTTDGGVEVDAERLLMLTVQCLKQVLRRAGPDKKAIAGVGISCFWHSLVGIGRDGRAVTPVYSWADTRSRGQATSLQQRFAPHDYHARTGCELHPSFWPAKLLWLREAQPDRVASVHQWMGFGEYVLLRLFGRTAASLSMASGTGLFNQSRANWDETTLDALQIGSAHLPPLAETGERLCGPANEFHRTLGPLSDVPWFPPIGDGACSNVGSGAVDERRIAINIGTSAAMRVVAPAKRATHLDIVQGLFCYRVDDDNVLFGGAFANGGNVHAWLKSALRFEDSPAFSRQVSAVSPDGHGLTVLPFWSGERSPGWHANARAVITGMNLHTTPADIVRASLEACAYSFDVVRERLQERFPHAQEIVASGGALDRDPVWAQILADVFGTPIVTSKVSEASCRGAGLLALNALGHLKRLSDAPFIKGRTYRPDAARHDGYAGGRERYRKLYDQVLRQ